jgi:hypothetical protein
VYSHWLPDTTARKGVDRLDDTLPNVARRDRRERSKRTSVVCFEW